MAYLGLIKKALDAVIAAFDISENAIRTQSTVLRLSSYQADLVSVGQGGFTQISLPQLLTGADSVNVSSLAGETGSYRVFARYYQTAARNNRIVDTILIDTTLRGGAEVPVYSPFLDIAILDDEGTLGAREFQLSIYVT